MSDCSTGGGHANMLWMDAAGSGHKAEFYDEFARFKHFFHQEIIHFIKLPCVCFVVDKEEPKPDKNLTRKGFLILRNQTNKRQNAYQPFHYDPTKTRKG